MVFNKRVMAMACADLDAMTSGTLHLRVPLLDDVIQIGIGGDPVVGIIQVTKTTTALRVCRVDGRAMQAELLRHDDRADGPVVRTTVFDRPVRRLVLQRDGTGSEPGTWVSAATFRDERHRSVEQFVRTIATFGLAKQRRLDGVPLG